MEWRDSVILHIYKEKYTIVLITGERSTEWRDRGIIPNLASGTEEPWSTCRSLNQLRVNKGRCRAIHMYVTVGRDRLCLIL